jgi:CHASE2 domain
MRLLFARELLRLRAAYLSVLIRSVLFALAATLLLQIDPFGIEESTASLASERAMKITSAFYPAFDVSRERVTVVLFTKDYLQRTHSVWPLRYDEQGKVLRAIAQFRPAAMFVDLLYKNAHPTSAGDARGPDVPRALLRAFPTDIQVPLYLAALHQPGASLVNDCSEHPEVVRPDGVIDRTSVHPDILSNSPVNPRLVLIEWAGCEDQYPLYFGADPAVMTPAYALFREYECRYEKRCQSRAEDVEYRRPLSVRGGAFPPTLQRSYYSADLCQFNEMPDSWFKRLGARLGVALNQLILAALPGVENLTRQDRLPCPAVNVIPASALIGVDGEQCRAPDAREECTHLRDLLTDKLVLIGAQLPGYEDYVDSPVHGQVPGVVFHAMALDNLLQFQLNYLQEPKGRASAFVLAFLTGVALLTYLMPPRGGRVLWTVGVMVWAGLSLAAAFRDEKELALIILGGGLILFILDPGALPRALVNFLLVCIASVAIIELWHFAPENWLILAVAAALVSEKVHADRHHREDAGSSELLQTTEVPSNGTNQRGS